MPAINADAERLGQVITNLLSNAIKYSPQNSDIRIATEVVDKHIQVSVSDEGYGIAESDQEKIFDRYYRVTTNNMNT
ncbi:sensor histidine kinase [Chitinophaga rhizophila]|uniref:histidine kinase n=1 Tax=Chitinophaga rhizophila TaxID=2866212 RepID=A0ABS7GAL5_9BACT|nr:ATP-binding protein [Chitinophaga rhizophila]